MKDILSFLKDLLLIKNEKTSIGLSQFKYAKVEAQTVSKRPRQSDSLTDLMRRSMN